ncbi:MAG: hypothetical protein L3J46_02245 [Kangiellaceae bacterium]|nr:hypothetical protein [Kangiellaceae bacterium]
MTHQKDIIELNDHMKMVFKEIEKEYNKPAKQRDYFYIKLLHEELGFEMTCVLRECRY